MGIHSSAIVSSKAQIDPSTEVGPNVVIEEDVVIGKNNKIYPNVYICKYTTIGDNNEIHFGSVIGHIPQDFAFDKNTKSYLKIGNNNVIREFVSIHRGTGEGSETVIGDNCYIMGYSHIGHNCKVGNGVKIANMAALSGYVEVGDGTFLSGYSLIHQFVRIGRLCMLGGGAKIGLDLPPFMMAIERNELGGINRVGLRRAGFTSEQITEVIKAFKILYRSGYTFTKAVEVLEEEVEKTNSAVMREILDFVKGESRRGILSTTTASKRHTEEYDEKIQETIADM